MTGRLTLRSSADAGDSRQQRRNVDTATQLKGGREAALSFVAYANVPVLSFVAISTAVHPLAKRHALWLSWVRGEW
jgi:hypothetical protein